jgi:hypothetical protein
MVILRGLGEQFFVSLVTFRDYFGKRLDTQSMSFTPKSCGTCRDISPQILVVGIGHFPSNLWLGVVRIGLFHHKTCGVMSGYFPPNGIS